MYRVKGLEGVDIKLEALSKHINEKGYKLHIWKKRCLPSLFFQTKMRENYSLKQYFLREELIFLC